MKTIIEKQILVSRNPAASLGPYRVQPVPIAPRQLFLTLPDLISDQKPPTNRNQKLDQGGGIFPSVYRMMMCPGGPTHRAQI